MQAKYRLTALITLSLLSAAAVTWVWLSHHQVLWPALIGMAPLAKKLVSWKALVSLLNQVPWMLAAGLKKYVVKIAGSLAAVHVGLRFPWVADQLAAIKGIGAAMLQRVQRHWQTCSVYEKVLIVFFSTALAILALALMILSKSLQILTLRKSSEATAEQLIKRSVSKAVDKKMKRLTKLPDQKEHDSGSQGSN